MKDVAIKFIDRGSNRSEPAAMTLHLLMARLPQLHKYNSYACKTLQPHTSALHSNLKCSNLQCDAQAASVGTQIALDSADVHAVSKRQAGRF